MNALALSWPYIAENALISALVMYWALTGRKKEAVGIEKSRDAKKVPQLLILLAAYLIYIFFSMFKKIEFGLGAFDAASYWRYFGEIPRSLTYYLKNVTKFEPGYSFVTWFFSLFTKEYRFVLLFWYTLSFSCIVNYVRRLHLNSHAYLPIFVIMLTLISQFNTLRMTLCISLGLIALEYLCDKKWLRGFLIILLSMSMQISAAILIPVFIVLFICDKLKYPSVAVSACLSALGSVAAFFCLKICMLYLFTGEKKMYLEGGGFFFPGTYIAIVFVFVLCAFKYKKMIELNALNKTLILMLPVGLVVMPLQYLVPIMYRMSMLFVPVLFGLIPSLIECYSKDVKYKLLPYFVGGSLYFYAAYRIVSFFTDEITFIGSYINTLL